MGFFPPDSTQGSVLNRPPNKASGAAGWFTDGSVTQQSTAVDADFLNGQVDEMLNLAVAGGVPLSKTSNTMVQNILNLITGIGIFVRKAGDTMQGALNINLNQGAPSPIPALVVGNGGVSLSVVAAATPGAYSPITQNGDTLLSYSAGAVNTGGLVLAPVGTGVTGGLRLDATGQATFTRPAYVPTAAPGTATTQIASTAFVTNSAFQLPFTPVQQGGAPNQLTNKVNIGWTGSKLRLAIDGTDQGNVALEVGAALTSATTNTSPPANDSSSALANTYWVANNYQPKQYNFSSSSQSANGQVLANGAVSDINLTYAVPVNGVLLMLGSTNVSIPSAGALTSTVYFNGGLRSSDTCVGSASLNNTIQVAAGTAVTHLYRVQGGGSTSQFTAHASLFFIPSN